MTAERERREASDNLPRTILAIAAGWTVPGLGHVVVGRVRRGVFFGLLLLGSYGLGLAHEGRLALRDERQPFLSTMQIVANLGIGPLDLVARTFVYGGPVYSLPRGIQNGVENRNSRTFRERTRSALSIYGTAYVWTAGLLNLLLLFDIWDIGKGRKS
jgi:hypothetical protein